MCGRYVRRSDKQKIAEHFRAKPNPLELPLPGEDASPTGSCDTPAKEEEAEDAEIEARQVAEEERLAKRSFLEKMGDGIFG